LKKRIKNSKLVEVCIFLEKFFEKITGCKMRIIRAEEFLGGVDSDDIELDDIEELPAGSSVQQIDLAI